ncbi:hypothetical protein K466DRAFT_535614 [Polyporus arcularius HHB13444]|uniref:Zn(2)-C6 fungal-type domain-containing protein n=1 Tax=Polyporus arcularius HHB13444 TaxID=1314778 RepID=A0A5C3Q832_9APHY|nr:hypothetical protein K466DRAFT_535614 [Polyporus arcularius HHB13444]
MTSAIDYSLDLDTTELETILGLSPSPSHTGTTSTSPGTYGVSEPSPTEYGVEQAGPSSSRSSSSAPPRTSKASRKRLRPKLDLAPGQPPTARGNARIRVFVACYQCRARKIRCDGAKPICHNCQKRPSEAEECSYDSGPNRRGRERGDARNHTSQQGSTAKKPPTRRRSAGRSRNRRSTNPSEYTSDHTETLNEEVFITQAQEPPSVQNDFFELPNAIMWEFDTDPLLYDVTTSTDISQFQVPGILVTPPQQGNRDSEQEQQEDSIPSRPGTKFARDTWWDALLSFYATERDPNDTAIVSLSLAQRSAAMKTIMADLRALLQASPCWVSFLHLPRFFDALFNPVRRSSLQPSLLLSALALGAFAQGSEVENGAQGRQKALKLLEMAHGALEGALATGWVDIGLAQAALLIVYFEMQSHPAQSIERSRSAILLLDSLTRMFSLATVDEGIKPRGRSPFTHLRPTASYTGFNPAAQLGFFTPQMAMNNHHAQMQTPVGPGLGATIAATLSPVSSYNSSASSSLSSSPTPSDPQRGCNCRALSLGTNWPSVHNIAPAFASSIMWPEGLAEGDFRREESRRLVWATVMVIANLHAYIASIPGSSAFETGTLFVREPENFALMLPGEALAATGTTVEPDDMWTLSIRTMLLVHVCMRVRESKGTSQADRAQLAVQAWLEIEDLEQRIARHTCDLDASFGFQSKELLFGLRMLTSYEFRNFIPLVTTTGSQLFYRDKAEDWLRDLNEHCDRWIANNLRMATASPSQDHRKSILIFWFMANIRRALMLWQNDPDLTFALEVSKRFAEHTERLMLFWPNMRLREVWQNLRMQLVAACLKAGIPPPSPNIPRWPQIPPVA